MSSLKYLHAAALEEMRIYAPLPLGLPRVVPKGGDTVDGHFLPAEVNGSFQFAMDYCRLANIDNCVDEYRSSKFFHGKF